MVKCWYKILHIIRKSAYGDICHDRNTIQGCYHIILKCFHLTQSISYITKNTLMMINHKPQRGQSSICLVGVDTVMKKDILSLYVMLLMNGKLHDSDTRGRGKLIQICCTTDT
jgi:hypothetical protein